MAPITVPLVNTALTAVTENTVRHAALAVEARLAEEFCGQLSQDREERTFRFEDQYKEFELLFHRLNELHRTGRIELWVLHTLQVQVQVQVAHLCAAQEQNFQEYRAILEMEQHFDEENTKQEDLVHDMEVREIVLLAVRDELVQREAGEVDTLLQGIDLSF